MSWFETSRLRALWQRLRHWLAARLGLLRGRWLRFAVDASVARWTWWPLPFSRASWECALYSPPGLADHDEAPLVVLLHGCGQHAMGFAHASGFVQAARAGRFRLLCPEQRERANAWRCWNWFHPPAQAGRGELQVILRALDATAEHVRCGPVAAVGLSAGAGLAALLGLHHADRFDAVVTVAAPPLLGRANLQDPRQVMKQGLAISPTLAALGLQACAPLLVLHGADDEVVTPRCADQLAEQALHVLRRAARAAAASNPQWTEQALPDGREHRVDGRVVLRVQLLPGLGHTWSGALGGHPHVAEAGPPLRDLALGFLRETGVLAEPG